MGTHTLPPDETARVGALCRYRVLDSPPEADFDEMVQLAASIYKAPIAAITFIDHDRQWVKAAVGLDTSQTDRPSGLCSFTIQGKDPMVIEDASADDRFSSHALVRGHPPCQILLRRASRHSRRVCGRHDCRNGFDSADGDGGRPPDHSTIGAADCGTPGTAHAEVRTIIRRLAVHG